MASVLITGGAGFIGSHLAERLVHDGQQVTLFDNLSSGTKENFASIAPKVNFVEGDVRDYDALVALAKGCQWVFHQAAIVSVPYSIEHPQESHDVNLQGTLNVLRAAQEGGVKRVIFASSAAVYGDDPELPKHEGLLPAPISPYGVEKLAGEHFCAVFSRLYPLEAVGLRYFNVFGPRQDPSSPYSGVISIFVDRLLSNKKALIYGDGKQTRDFVFVADVVEANLRAASADQAVGKVYNIGRGEQTSINQLVESLRSIDPALELTTEHAQPREGDIRYSVADIARAQQELGYHPTVSVRDGLGKLVAYQRKQPG